MTTRRLIRLSAVAKRPSRRPSAYMAQQIMLSQVDEPRVCRSTELDGIVGRSAVATPKRSVDFSSRGHEIARVI